MKQADQGRDPQPRRVHPHPPPLPGVSDVVYASVSFVVSTLLDVLHFALILVKKPLALLLVVYLLLLFISHLTPSLETILRPICATPILSHFITMCDSFSSTSPLLGSPNYSKLLELQDNFEGIMESASGSSLALDMKSSEMAIRDLTTLVKVSDLVAKDALISGLEAFVADARDASRGLQRLGSKVGGAVDNILALDEYVLRTLETIDNAPPPRPSSPTSQLFGYMIPFHSTPFSSAPERRTLVTSFNTASLEMQNQLKRLILEAETNIVVLDRLEEKLHSIHEMVQREHSVVQDKRDQVLAELWTILGGNRQILAKFSSHRTLLLDVSGYRSRALGRVSSTLVQLQQLCADLEELRDRVAAPALIGDDAIIPLEVHVESIRKGIERVGEFRRRSVERENEQLRKMLSESSQMGAKIEA